MMEMDLDCTNLKSYAPSRKLYYQLLRYPQEIIPLLDHTLTEIVLEKFPEATHLTENDMMKVRPFHLGQSVNLRELNPSGNFLIFYLLRK
jgi:DNA replication licensing factor MCM4